MTGCPSRTRACGLFLLLVLSCLGRPRCQLTAPAATAGIPALQTPAATCAATPTPSPPAEAETETYLVTLVIDGDTFELESGERVRLIGMDTPAMDDLRPAVRALAEEATAFTRRMVEGKRVRLEYDQELYDKYGRTLAYVYLEDGTFVNVEIIPQGYGFVETRFPFKRLEEFRMWELEARGAGRGLWGK